MKRTGPRTEPLGTPQVRQDEGVLCERIPTVDVWDEIYKMNHCSETEQIPNQVESRWSRMEWSRVSKVADRSRRQKQETCCIEIMQPSNQIERSHNIKQNNIQILYI